jgi:hypothetical protein
MCGQIEIIAQIRVTRTKRMSRDAKRLFLSPNWIGVKAKLKMRFKINGRATTNAISFL